MTTQTHNLELLGISSVYSSICLVCCSFVFTLVQFCLPDTGVELSVDEISLFLARTLPLNWLIVVQHRNLKTMLFGPCFVFSCTSSLSGQPVDL